MEYAPASAQARDKDNQLVDTALAFVRFLAHLDKYCLHVGIIHNRFLPLSTLND